MDYRSQALLDPSVNQGSFANGGSADGPLLGPPNGIQHVISTGSNDPDVLTPTPKIGDRASKSVLSSAGIEGAQPEPRDSTPVVFEEASLRATLFNVINSVLGAGALGLPYATRLDGMALGAILIALIGFFSERTAYFLLHATEHTRARLYSQAAAKIYGPTAGTVVDLTIIVQNLGLLCSYTVVIGDLIPSVIAAWAPHGHDGEPYDGTFAPGHAKGRLLIQIICAAVIFLPLSSLANLDALKFTSIMAVVAVGATVLVVAIVSGLALHDEKFVPDDEKIVVPGTDPAHGGAATNHTELLPGYIVRAGPSSFLSFLESVPMVFTAYVAHNNILLLYTELRRRSTHERASRFESKKSKMMAAVRVGLASCCGLYLVVGCFGYVLFRENTESDILANFKSSQYPFVAFIKLAYAVVIAFSFPLIALALRKSVHALLFGRDAPVTWMHRIGEAVGCVAVATALGASVPNLGVVTGLTGALAAVQLMYVYPSAMMLRMWWVQGGGEESGDGQSAKLLGGSQVGSSEAEWTGASSGGADDQDAESKADGGAAPQLGDSGTSAEGPNSSHHRPAMPGGTGQVSELEAGTAWFTLSLGIAVALLSTAATVIQLARGNTGS